jgi:molybdopterin-containing oxidoreductase family iron-sulfur binding subunit
MMASKDHNYWRSLDELANTPAFRRWVEDEFPDLWERIATGGNPHTRRQFLKLAGATLALGGLTACRWPKEAIVPATRQPGNRVPGVPVQYATTYELSGVATGVLVTSYDGRPIKIEGNDKHPFSLGKTNHWMQAAVLDLYDPDRSQHILQRTSGTDRYLSRSLDDFRTFAAQHFERLRAVGGAGLCVLSEPSSSPSRLDMKSRFLAAFPQAQWIEYEPISRDNEHNGARLAFGRPYRSHLHLERADVLVALDSDFLMLHPAALKYARDFAARRRPDAANGYDCNRLYVLESNFSVTGSMADRRYAVRSSDIRTALEHIAQAVAARLDVATKLPAPVGDLPLSEAAAEAIAADLVAHRGRCAIIVGPQQPAEVHVEAHLLNDWLGTHGETITFTAEPAAERTDYAAGMAALAEQIRAGGVDTLVILGGNPVYDAPAELGFGRASGQSPDAACAFDKIGTTVRLGLYFDETSRCCDWHLPQAHWLEAWGDGLAWNGTLSVAQPLIEPLYGGLSAIELLAMLADDKLSSGYEIVRRTFSERFGALESHEERWKQSLHDGVVADTAWPTEKPDIRPITLPPAKPTSGFEVVFTPDYSLYDGRFANNGWLQEWPDPITKLTWGNAAILSPEDAARLGVERDGDLLFIDVGAGATLNVPAYVLPGHATGSITLPLGYGRFDTGFNAYQLRRSAGLDIAAAGQCRRVEGREELAGTQDHHAIRSKVGDAEIQKRIPVLVREAELHHYREHPDFAEHVVHVPASESLWREKEYTGHKWGMAIDLSACTGCGACVLACQAENNIPVVGPDEVRRGREMHWLRIDRYFRKDTEGAAGGNAQPVAVVHQPMACTHCENAPCEQVCPVAATVHDEDGLNTMVYNRCVGTRYCSNNCPLKVRRFNWFYNHHGPYHPRSIRMGTSPLPGALLKHAELTDIEKMGQNPAVTVRSRGVMEKCTFCVQRITAVKIKARKEGWTSIPDGLITPACAAACPSDAIVFGDLNDPRSRVRQLHEHPRAYPILAELNLRPRTVYLAKIRNAGSGTDEEHGQHGA